MSNGAKKMMAASRKKRKILVNRKLPHNTTMALQSNAQMNAIEYKIYTKYVYYGITRISLAIFCQLLFKLLLVFIATCCLLTQIHTAIREHCTNQKHIFNSLNCRTITKQNKTEFHGKVWAFLLFYFNVTGVVATLLPKKTKYPLNQIFVKFVSSYLAVHLINWHSISLNF